MEKPRYGLKPVVGAIVLVLGLIAFSCCVAAEFKSAKAKDMKLDGNLCSLPRTPAYGLGITAILGLSIAQVMGTSASGSRLCSRERKSGAEGEGKKPIMAITLLVLSWFSYGLTMILLGPASSMNGGQSYGRGWLDGKCYVVKPGVHLAAAVLVAVAIIFIIGFTLTAKKMAPTLPLARLDVQSKGEMNKTKGMMQA